VKILHFKLDCIEGADVASFIMKPSLLKEYSIKRHESKLAAQLNGMQSQLKRNKITQLTNSLVQLQSLLLKFNLTI
jgi:hypothetical protein